ncbi:MAG: hypothetical protein DME17_19790 [Candidatus Rokuibacteriota bacterium]|nr:MAG: hypothetical protein DME17_19790 [Candidatus Rokubacteria bacterium]
MTTRRATTLFWLLVVVAILGQPLSTSAANLLAQFDGLSNSDNVAITGSSLLPPDNGVAVGKNDVFEMVNIVGRLTDKLGGNISSFSLRSFFGVDASFSGESDPRVLYDVASGRWFATYLQFSIPRASSSIILAVSTTGDPRGTFCRYRLGNPTSEIFLQDFPMVGTSDDKIVVTYNGFAFLATSIGGFIGGGAYVLKKADLLAGGCASQVGLVRLPPDSSRFTLQPAQSLGSTSDLFLAMHSRDSSTLILFRISGIPGVTSVTETPVSLPIRAWASPPQALQASSSVVLDTNDDRVLSVSWQQNSLWVAGTEACTPPGDTAARSCLRLIEVRTDTSSVRQDMSFGVTGQYYSFPALRPDAARNLHVVFTSSSANSFASVRVAGRLATDPLNTLRPSIEIRAGLGAQTSLSGRMGDYAGAAVDPTAPLSVWVSGEYMGSTASAPWRTYIARLEFANPAPAAHPDFDGDAKADIGVYRPSTGIWYVLRSSDGTPQLVTWGASGDVPVTGDFDGDGKTDVATFRPSTGIWYILRSSDGKLQQVTWGAPGDVPVTGDFDGDGKTDVATYRPSTGIWYILRSSDGKLHQVTWGAVGDQPLALRHR